LTWPKDKQGQVGGGGGWKGLDGVTRGPKRSASLQKLIDIVALAAADSWR